MARGNDPKKRNPRSVHEDGILAVIYEVTSKPRTNARRGITINIVKFAKLSRISPRRACATFFYLNPKFITCLRVSRFVCYRHLSTFNLPWASSCPQFPFQRPIIPSHSSNYVSPSNRSASTIPSDDVEVINYLKFN